MRVNIIKPVLRETENVYTSIWIIICYKIVESQYILYISVINYLFTYLHTYSFAHSLAHSLTHSLTHSLNYSINQSLTHIHSLTQSLTHTLTHSLNKLLNQSITHSHTLTHAITHSRNHSLTHALTCLLFTILNTIHYMHVHLIRISRFTSARPTVWKVSDLTWSSRLNLFLR